MYTRGKSTDINTINCIFKKIRTITGGWEVLSAGEF